MKRITRSLGILPAALVVGCATKPSSDSVCSPIAKPTAAAPAAPAVNLSGQWVWTCCEGHYQGPIELHQEGNQITGGIHDENDPDGSELNGCVTGKDIPATRTLNDSEPQYELT